MAKAIKNYLMLSGVIAFIIAAAFGGVAPLVSGWTMIFAPFLIAVCAKAAAWLTDRMEWS